MDSLLNANPNYNPESENPVDRRQWVRIPPEIVQTTIYYAERKIPGSIVDESFGGVGLLVDHDPEIPVGTTIGVLYHGFLMKGIVRFSKTFQPAEHRMGVEWC